jgi:hypothetical protein
MSLFPDYVAFVKKYGDASEREQGRLALIFIREFAVGLRDCYRGKLAPDGIALVDGNELVIRLAAVGVSRLCGSFGSVVDYPGMQFIEFLNEYATRGAANESRLNAVAKRVLSWPVPDA